MDAELAGVEEFLRAAEDNAWRAQAQQSLSRDGRVQLLNFISAPAAAGLLSQCEHLPWTLHFNKAGQTFRVPHQELAAMTAEARKAFQANMAAGVEPPFINDNYHITDLYRSGKRDGALAEFYAQLNSERGLRAMRRLVGDDRIVFADAVVSRYRPGQYLASHTDFAPDEERLYAYVLSLAPEWRVHWGGQLLFLDDKANVTAGYTPRPGALVIFKVPQQHAVSVVASFAPPTRVAISGWLHASLPQRFASGRPV